MKHHHRRLPLPDDLVPVVTYLERTLRHDRFEHTLATARVAVDLARRNGVNTRKALTAALLHDAGKSLTVRQMIAYARRHRLPVPGRSEIFRYHAELLHSYISADIARRLFGIRDREVLNAIAHHTLGSTSMGRLAKIVYLSDAISPDRRYPGVGKLRWESKRDLDAAFLMAMAQKVCHVVTRRQWINPLTVRAWNALVRGKRA